jgi:hypothetical protein
MLEDINEANKKLRKAKSDIRKELKYKSRDDYASGGFLIPMLVIGVIGGIIVMITVGFN